jgi:hypothetical protein
MCIHEFEISEGAFQRWVSAFEKFFLHCHLWITLDCTRDLSIQSNNGEKHRNILVSESVHCLGMEYQLIYTRSGGGSTAAAELIHVLNKKEGAVLKQGQPLYCCGLLHYSAIS